MQQMTIEQHHLMAEIDGDTIQLSQNNSLDEPDCIVLHISQLCHLAEWAGISRASAQSASSRHYDDPDEMDSLAMFVGDGGLVTVSQTRARGMGGSDHYIELHPIQAEWLAAKLSRIAEQSNADDGGTEG